MKPTRDPAAVSNAVSEDEPVSHKEAIACIKWLQKECDKFIQLHVQLCQEIMAASAASLKRSTE